MNFIESNYKHSLPLLPRDTSVLISVKRLSRPQNHNEAGRIKSMKNSNYPIESRTSDIPACSTVPQQTAPPRKNGQCGQNTRTDSLDYIF